MVSSSTRWKHNYTKEYLARGRTKSPDLRVRPKRSAPMHPGAPLFCCTPRNLSVHFFERRKENGCGLASQKNTNPITPVCHRVVAFQLFLETDRPHRRSRYRSCFYDRRHCAFRIRGRRSDRHSPGNFRFFAHASEHFLAIGCIHSAIPQLIFQCLV